MKIQSTSSLFVRILFCIMALSFMSACSKGFQIIADQDNNQNTATADCKPQNCVTLTWDPVTTDKDGKPITVTGYTLYYGPATGYYPKNIDVKNGVIASVPNLTPGTYFFAVKAYIITYSNGVQSQLSSELSNEVSDTLIATKAEMEEFSPEISVTIH